jgi:hypothetical protein
MLQLEVSAQVTVLPAPRLSLQSALPEQVAVELLPALSSHFDDDSQMMWLPAPPMPLHSEVSPQTTVVEPVDEALHFAAVSHWIEHVAEPQLALQVVPAVHVHEAAMQAQPAPLQVGPPSVWLGLELPQEIAANAPRARSRNRARIEASMFTDSSSRPRSTRMKQRLIDRSAVALEWPGRDRRGPSWLVAV